MSMLEAEPAAPRRKRKPAASDKACHKRTRHEDTVVSVAEIDKLLTDHEARASNKTVDSSCTSVWMALNVVLDHCTFE